MKTKHPALLVHPVFLGCLALLLLNDLYFKYAFHNWLTGKLSDFAGLFVFAVFFISLWPGRRRTVILVCALLFCWWKSPLSSGVIGFFNHTLAWPVHRVVDYTDYTALPVLVLAYAIKPYVYPAALFRHAFVYLSGILSLFAFCATSMPRYMQVTDTYVNKNIRTPLKSSGIRKKFAERNIALQQDTAYFQRMYDQDVYVKTEDSSGMKHMIPLRNYIQGELYYQRKVYDSTYTIPWMLVKNDTLKNIRFSIHETPNGKRSIISLRSFLYDTVLPPGTTLDPWLRKKYRRPLAGKIKEIVK